MKNVALRLATLVADLIGLERESLDTESPLVDLGLDSLKAIELAARWSQETGRTVSPAMVWEHPTLAALAAALSAEGGPPTRPPASAAPRPTAATTDEPIAVIGAACRLPGGASSPGRFWELLRTGHDAIGPVPSDRWDADALWDPDPAAPGRSVTRQGGFLDDVAGFDAAFFGLSPREAEQMDPQQRLALELAWECLDDAGVSADRLGGTATGVFLGAIWNDYRLLSAEAPEATTPHTGTGGALNLVANRVSYTLGLSGPSLVVDTACSSSLVAIHLACQSLRRGESTLALAGGVNLMLSSATMIALSKLGALAPDGRCKSFAASADGFGRGEGGVFVALEPLSRALANGRNVLCVIRGSAVNQDGRSNGLTAPSPRAQEAVIRAACGDAGVQPLHVDYVEAHGAGTLLGDPIEAQALGAVYGAARRGVRTLRLGAVKSNIGHLEGAAGAAGFLKVALSLAHGELPPSLHYDAPNPHIDFEGDALEVQRRLEPWPDGGSRPLAGVSAFGWGGTNCHVVVEGPPGAGSAPIVHGESTPGSAPGDLPTAFVFSPQGGQWAGMARGLLHDEPAFRETARELDRVLSPRLGFSLLRALSDPRPDAGPWLSRAEYVQPLIFAVQAGLVATLRDHGVEPAAVVGHSLGEIAAAWTAGALTLEEAALAVYHYSRHQSRTARGGGMAAVGLSRAQLEPLLAEHPGVVVAGENAPSRLNVSGPTDRLDALVARIRADGSPAARIDVDVAAHGAAIDEIHDALVADLEFLQPKTAELPLYSTLTGEQLTERRPDGAYFAEELRRPVRFRQAIERMLGDGIRRFVELGAHPVLGDALRETVTAAGADADIRCGLRRGDVEGASLQSTLAAVAQPSAPGIADGSDGAARVLAVSAHGEPALRARAGNYVGLADTPTALAHTLGARVGHLPRRAAVVVRTADEARGALTALANDAPTCDAIHGDASLARTASVVFVFPGQGSQWAGMGATLLREEPVFAAEFARCEAALAPHMESSVRAAVTGSQEPDAIELVQPTLFAMAVSLAALWRSWGIEPAAVIGHSQGEIAAACVSGALTLEDAALVVARRSRLLRRVAGNGAMAVVELDETETTRRIESRPPSENGDLSVAAINGDQTTVVSGTPAAIDALVAQLEVDGVFARRVSVDIASHGPQMDPLRDDLLAALADIIPSRGRVPLLSTVDEAPLSGEELDGEYWTRNLRHPVRFTSAVRAAHGAGHRVFVEMSPHPLLTSSLQPLLESAGDGAVAVGSLRRGRGDRAQLLTGLATLWTRGLAIDWERVQPAARAVRVPPYPFQRRPHWLPERDADGRGATTRPTAAPDGFHAHIEASTAPGTHYLDARLDPERTPALAAHAVDGAPVVPAGALLDLTLRGIQRVRASQRQQDAGSDAPITLDDVQLAAPLAPDADVQLVLTEDDWRLAARGGGGGWEVVANGRRGPSSDAGPPLGFDSDPNGCAPQSVDAHYAGLADRGVDYGGPLRSVTSVRRGGGRAEATLGNSDGAPLDRRTALDACFQTLAAAVEISGKLLVVGVDRVVWRDGDTAPARAIATVTADGRRGDVLLLDGRNRPLAELRGARLTFPQELLWTERWDEVTRPTHPAAPTPMGRVVLVGGPEPLARALRDRLGAAEWMPTLDALFGPAQLAGSTAILLNGLALDAGDTDGDTGERLLGAVTVAGSALVTARTARRVFVLTQRADRLPGDRATPAPGATALHGLARVVQTEHGDGVADAVRVIDVDDPTVPETFSALMTEITAPTGDASHPRVAIRSGRVFAPRRVLVQGEPSPLRPWSGPLLITGGLGGIGLAVARWAVERGAHDLVLAGRRPPTGEVAAVLDSLRADATVETVSLDVTDSDAVGALFDRLERAGRPVAAVFHAAAVIDDALVADTDDARLRRVLAPKVRGAWNLHHATRSRALQHFVLFGSVGGWIGLPGQAAYAAGNAFLDGLAEHREALGLPATSVAWCGWRDLGFASTGGGQDVLAFLEEQGVGTLAPPQALAVLERILTGDPPPRVAVLPRVERQEQSTTSQDEPAAVRAIRAARPRRRRATLLLEAVREAVAAVLRCEPSGVAPERPLREQGLDSLMAAELSVALERRLGVALSKMAVWQHPTAQALADVLFERMGLEEEPAQEESREPEDACEPEKAPGSQSQGWQDMLAGLPADQAAALRAALEGDGGL